MPLSLWAELMDDASVVAALPTLAARGLGLGLALPAARVGDSAFAELTRRAYRAGVPVRLWPLLDRARGYWIGATNVEQTRDLMTALLTWRARRGGPAFDGVSLDLEPPFEYSEALRRTARRRPDKALELLVANHRPAALARARASLARTVQSVRRAGVVAHAVTYPLVLDQAEGDTAIEDALSIPVTGIDWDEVSFMVYQTPFAQLLGRWLGPSLVASYARTAVERFGERAGIDVGIVGEHGVGIDAGSRYPDAASLHADLGASLSEGIPLARSRVYGLAGVLDCGGVDRWLGATPRPRPCPPSREVEGFRNLVRGVARGLRALRRPVTERPARTAQRLSWVGELLAGRAGARQGRGRPRHAGSEDSRPGSGGRA